MIPRELNRLSAQIQNMNYPCTIIKQLHTDLARMESNMKHISWILFKCKHFKCMDYVMFWLVMGLRFYRHFFCIAQYVIHDGAKYVLRISVHSSNIINVTMSQERANIDNTVSGQWPFILTFVLSLKRKSLRQYLTSSHCCASFLEV